MAGTVLAVRTDIKKDSVKIKVVDEVNNKKSDNAADIQVFFPNKNITTTSNCVFPEKYNDTILMNCTISDLGDIDPYTEGFQYLNTSDKMFIALSYLKLNNFFQANSIIPEHNNIIRESNKTNIVCTTLNNTNNAIAGIVVASVVAFLAIVGIALCLI